MALEHIREAVLESARKEAERILDAARAAAQDRLNAGMETARAEAERRYRATVRAVEEDCARQLIQYRGTANKELLALRNERLREVFEAARAAILAWPREEYAAFLRPMLENATAGTGGVVRVHAAEREIFAAALEELNATRSEDRALRLDEEALPERGGFVFIGSNYEVDQTLGTLLSDIEHELSPAIAAELFRQD